MATKNKNKIVLLDMHAILHRAYHALPDFETRSGKPTGALYGLVTMIFSIIQKLKPDYIIACYDLPGGTFRHEKSVSYKANRKETDDSLVSQIIESRDVLNALSIPFVELPGYEADDLLGTISEQLKKDKDNEIIIASGDMDTLQLVDGKQVQVFTLKKGIKDTILYDEKAVIERFNFEPKLLPDFKGLRGDTSDNITGIPGIGEKTATTLISQFGSLESIYETLKKDENKIKKAGISDRMINLLKEGEDDAFFSKELGEIVLDAPISFKLPKHKWLEGVSWDETKNIFDDLEFRSIKEKWRELIGGEKETEVSIDSDEDDIHKTLVALWLVEPDKTNSSVEDLLSFAKTKSYEDAKKKVFDEIKKQKLEKVWKEIEEPIIPIVKEMKQNGVLIDQKYFEKLAKDYHKKLDEIESKIFNLAGFEFNLKSPKQLSEVLFEKLGISTKGIKRSASGYYSTQVSVLEKIKDLHPVVSLIEDYRELQKLLSTYIDVIPGLVDKDGRLRADFVQNGTTTGRFSSNNPNLQNIPIKSDLGRVIRDGFIADTGKVLLGFDYSQIELRLTAILSGDEFLTKAFKEGKDIHRSVASRVFNVKEEEVDSEMRRKAKTINFGIIYGMGVTALTKSLDTTRKEAQAFYDSYFEEFSSIQKYLEGTKEFARKNGYTETMFGRRRYFKDINSHIPFIKAMAERTAINAPIQGTAADIIKLAMRFVSERLEREGLKKDCKLILQIHDELIFEADEKVKEKCMKIIDEEMEAVLEKGGIKNVEVPLTVSADSGSNWGQLK